MKELSIFVDESGDFGNYEKHAPFYIISMVFHDQSINITPNIKKLDKELNYLGCSCHAVHTEPLIRRETPYQYYTPDERRTIFSKLFYFILSCNIQYKTFVFHKNKYPDTLHLETHMIRKLSYFIRDNLEYFQQFDKVILYYDNGQHELSHILNTVFSTELTNYHIRKVLPSDYKLFQAADLICTLELLSLKIESNDLSRSEKIVFHSKRDLKKDFLKGIRKKELFSPLKTPASV